MPAERREVYWMGITVIEAQDALVQISIADYPHMKKESRTKLHRDLHEKAYPKYYESLESAPTITTQQLATRLGALLNG